MILIAFQLVAAVGMGIVDSGNTDKGLEVVEQLQRTLLGETQMTPLDVAAAAGDETLPEIRVGAAWGPTLSWQGDLFGPTVNLASRLVNIARPGTVLISETMAAELQSDPTLVVRLLRPLRLKGLGKVTFAALRPAMNPELSTAKKRLSKKGKRDTAP